MNKSLSLGGHYDSKSVKSMLLVASPAFVTLATSIIAELLQRYYFSHALDETPTLLYDLTATARVAGGLGVAINLVVVAVSLVGVIFFYRIDRFANNFRDRFLGMSARIDTINANVDTVKSEQKSALLDIEQGTREMLTQVDEHIGEQIQSFRKEHNQFREELSAGIVKFEGKSYRSLRYDPNKGSMFYEGDKEGNRNILINNQTLSNMLRSLVEATPRKDRNTPRSLLYRMGCAASASFASVFVEECEDESRLGDALEDWLRTWIKYDRLAGFGLMDLDTGSFESDRIYRVLIRFSFLSIEESLSKHEFLADFMIGYIFGLVSHFPPRLFERLDARIQDVQVSHEYESHSVYGHRDRKLGDVFLIHVPRNHARPSRSKSEATIGEGLG